jgi:threonine dehydrogenase-like Zn-dependent dehydrogenase
MYHSCFSSIYSCTGFLIRLNQLKYNSQQVRLSYSSLLILHWIDSFEFVVRFGGEEQCFVTDPLSYQIMMDHSISNWSVFCDSIVVVSVLMKQQCSSWSKNQSISIVGVVVAVAAAAAAAFAAGNVVVVGAVGSMNDVIMRMMILRRKIPLSMVVVEIHSDYYYHVLAETSSILMMRTMKRS